MIFLGIVLLGTVLYFIVSDWLFLKRDLTKVNRLKIYSETMVAQWANLFILLFAWLISDFNWIELFKIEGSTVIEYSTPFLLGFLTSVGVALLIFIISLRAKKGASNQLFVGNIDFLLPRTRKERLAFVFVAATAGICEEIIFRGAMAMFLLALPFNFSLSTAAVISAILFGLAHYYQGIKGMIGTGILGYIMFNLYVASGSLLLPILFHFIIDLKFVFIPNGKLTEIK